MTKLGSFEFRELEKYRHNLKAMENAIPGLLVECLQDRAKLLLDKVISRTPTEIGELRKGWKIGKVSITSNGAEIEVFNSEASSLNVEFGHRSTENQSWVEGRFIMTISLQELERDLPSVLAKKMNRFVKRFLR